MPDYTNAAQQRMLKIIQAMSGNELKGVKQSDFVSAFKVSAGTIVRDLDNLETAGWAERVPGLEDRWRLTPAVIQIAVRHQQHVMNMQSKLDDVKQRYSRV